MTDKHICAEIQYETEEGVVHSDLCFDGELTEEHKDLLREAFSEFLRKAPSDLTSSHFVVNWLLPEAPEVPKWAQGCDTQNFDPRIVATDDRRLWRPFIVRRREIQEWQAADGSGTKTTEELVAMRARLLIDHDGKAVL